MNRWVRVAPALLIGALLAVTTVAVSASVAGAAPATAGVGASVLQVTPIGAAGTQAVDPGATVKRAFVVTNRSSSLRVTVRLATVDATAGPGGSVKYARSASASGPGSWLTLSDVVTTLEPGANVHVSMNITPPDNATPGDVTAGLIARVDHAARASDNQAVDTPGEVSLPISIKVKGAATALVSIASVKALKDGGSTYLEITFQNSGATPATMSGQVQVAGANPKTDPVRTTIPPLTHTKVRVPFTMPSGSHTVPVSVSTQDARGNEATWGGDIGSDASASSSALATVPSTPATSHHESAAPRAKGSSFPSPLLIVVALLFLAAAVWFALEFRRSRAGRRARVAAVPSSVSGPVAPVSTGVAADAGQMGAVASQLAALVASIDRLVARLGDVAVPVAGAASPSPFPSPQSEPVPANPAPMFFAPAAQRGPEAEFDPYDWPSQQQLDDFAARRRAGQSDS